jgi:hypothetical protein
MGHDWFLYFKLAITSAALCTMTIARYRSGVKTKWSVRRGTLKAIMCYVFEFF